MNNKLRIGQLVPDTSVNILTPDSLYFSKPNLTSDIDLGS